MFMLCSGNDPNHATAPCQKVSVAAVPGWYVNVVFRQHGGWSAADKGPSAVNAEDFSAKAAFSFSSRLAPKGGNLPDDKQCERISEAVGAIVRRGPRRLYDTACPGHHMLMRTKRDLPILADSVLFRSGFVLPVKARGKTKAKCP